MGQRAMQEQQKKDAGMEGVKAGHGHGSIRQRQTPGVQLTDQRQF
jgi:hypothetical protein